MDFRPGDILIEYDDSTDEAQHALLWVDDGWSKHIIHGKDTGLLLGVVQQSVSALRRTGEDIKYLVYRHKDEHIAAAAAGFARVWATRSDDPMVNAMMRFAASRGQKVGAKTPFGRRGDAYQTNDAWNAQSLVRAVRAWNRGVNNVGLSRSKGVSCSQLVTYCYQAACLNSVLHAHYLGVEQWRDWLRGPQSFVALKKGDRYNLVFDALQCMDEQVRAAMPTSMLVDAKTTDAENLQDCLEADPAFQVAGEVATDNWQSPTRAWIEPEAD